jgi:hypothetical protein
MNETLRSILIISILVVMIVVTSLTMKLFNNANAHFWSSISSKQDGGRI